LKVIWRGIVLAVTITTLAMAGVTDARAGVMLVTSRAALSPNDSIDWGQLGPDSTSLGTSEDVTSASGLNATVSTDDLSGLLRADEGRSWTGNFTIGDHLINNNGFSEFALTVNFAAPISGAGAQIQLDNSGPFTATLEAFAGNTSLGLFTENGQSSTAEDGSAIFLGVIDTIAEITSIVFGIENPPPFRGDFAINTLSLNTVPEPSSIVLTMIAILASLAFWRLRSIASLLPIIGRALAERGLERGRC
jgi:hypothetical protein